MNKMDKILLKHILSNLYGEAQTQFNTVPEAFANLTKIVEKYANKIEKLFYENPTKRRTN